MCGIAGFIDPRRRLAAPVATLEAMQRCLAHRGPDDFGAWWDEGAGVGLGHRRLAVVDLSPAGHQPMRSASGRYRIVFNGEIYNFERLRREPELRDVPWRSGSDTEVLLEGFERLGVEETLRRTIGMFALAVWDSQERTLSLARDRVGKKPLYFGWCGEDRSVFAFASELHALRTLPGFDDAVDPDALAAYLRLLYVPGPGSIHAGIGKLPPGCVARLRLDERSASDRPEPVVAAYWSAHEAIRRGRVDPFRGSAEEAVEALEALLLDAVELRMIADVPLGAFLSGGIDSTAVVALMQRAARAQSASAVRTFTIGFHEAEYNEATHAKAIAAHLGTDHTEHYLTADDALRTVPELARTWDEPFADSSQIPTLLLSRITRRDVTVALSGDGGDELFGGYNRYLWATRIWEKVAWMPTGARQALAGAMRSTGPATWDQLALPLRALAGRRVPAGFGLKVHKLAELIASPSSAALYSRLVSSGADAAALLVGGAAPAAVLGAGERLLEGLSPIERMMALDLTTYLVDDILVKVDRASMAVALETRAPLLDHRVVEFAWRLPLAVRMRGGVGKWPLRRIVDRHVPRALMERPKMGFGVPIAQWLAGALRDWAESLLSESNLRHDGMLEAEAVRALWRSYLGGARASWPAVWGVLMYLSWRDAVRARAR